MALLRRRPSAACAALVWSSLVYSPTSFVPCRAAVTPLKQACCIGCICINKKNLQGGRQIAHDADAGPDMPEAWLSLFAAAVFEGGVMPFNPFPNWEAVALLVNRGCAQAVDDCLGVRRSLLYFRVFGRIFTFFPCTVPLSLRQGGGSKQKMVGPSEFS